jgi:hypothetical protein
VSLVGYTNVGKSTLFNRLTGGRVAGRSAVRDARPDLRRLPLPDAVSRWCWRTPSVSSASCRTNWSPRSARRCTRRARPTCCCTWSMPSESAPGASTTSRWCWRRSVRGTCRRSWSTTRSTRCPATTDRCRHGWTAGRTAASRGSGFRRRRARVSTSCWRLSRSTFPEARCANVCSWGRRTARSGPGCSAMRRWTPSSPRNSAAGRCRSPCQPAGGSGSCTRTTR